MEKSLILMFLILVAQTGALQPNETIAVAKGLGAAGGRQGKGANELVEAVKRESDNGMFALRRGEYWEIFMTFKLLGVLELDDDGILKTQFRLLVSWRDEQLAYDPKKFDNYNRIVVPSQFARYPHLVLLENAERETLRQKMSEYPIVITNDGTNSIESEVTTYTYCNMDVSLFPNDYHSCQIKIALAPLQVKFFGKLKVKHETSNMFNENPDWPLQGKVTAGIQKTPEMADNNQIQYNFDFAYMNVTVRRNGESVSTALVNPMYCFSFLTALVFILPPSSGERVGTAITLLLTISVTMISVKDLLPTELPESEGIYFKTFVNMTFLQTITAFIETLAVLALSDMNCNFLRTMGKARTSSSYDPKKGDERGSEKEKDSEFSKKLARAVDYIFLVVNLCVSVYYISMTHSNIHRAMPEGEGPEIEDNPMEFPQETYTV